MTNADSLQITIERQTINSWPVIAEYRPAGFQLASRKEGELRLAEGWKKELLERDLDREAYGRFLGQALFQDQIRDALMHARGQAEEQLRLLLVIEDVDLKTLHWERLCAPIGPAGSWSLLALDKQVIYSNYLPSLSEKRFPPIGRRDLRALVVVANPPEYNDYQLDTFDEEATITSISSALENIPYDILASNGEAIGPPTLNELAGRLSEETYSLLHIVAHSQFQPKSGETILYLKKDKANQVQPVPATRLIQRLWNVAPLPHLIFLAACESAAPGAEGTGSLGGLAQRLVWEIGVPAVVAMTEKVSIPTASTLTTGFYRQLQKSGEVDRALTEANTWLAEADDVTVAALYSRLGGRPLFSDTGRDPTSSEIADGLKELERLLPERAPVLEGRFDELAAVVRGTSETDLDALSKEVRQERQAALEDIDELCLEILDLDFNALAMGQEPPPYDSRNPFRGLYAFRPEDSQFFFGREALVEKLLDKVSDHNFLAVLGPSGSGKSSLVLAGVLPRLMEQRTDLQVAYLTPGSKPLAHLQAARHELSGGPILAVVDQFEELFTQGADEAARQDFVGQLLALAEKEPVILTMRADFWGECAVYDELKAEMQAHQELVGPMTSAQLRAAMEQQAAAVGLRFEADLSQTMLDAVKDEPGAMPLLQHSLRQLWLRRHGRWLLTSEYREIGGVQKAIAETAEKIYREVGQEEGVEERQRMRQIFIRLTRLDQGDGQVEEVRDTRQRVRLDELVPAGQDPQATHKLVKKLGDERLVVTSLNPVTEEEEVEVAHEALIRYWPRLQEWLNEDRDLLRLRAGIREATQEWLNNEREAGFLFHGARLTAAEEYYQSDGAELNEDERAFIEASIRRREEQLEEKLELERQKTEAERQRAEEAEAATKRQRRLTWIALGILAVALVAAILAGFFGIESNQNAALAQTREAEAVAAKVNADHNADIAATREAEAEAQALKAQTQALMSLSTSLLPVNRNPFSDEVERSLLMNAQALTTSQRLKQPISARLLNEQARRLLSYIQAQPSHKVLRDHEDWVTSVAYSPNREQLASVGGGQEGGGDRAIRLWDLRDPTAEPLVLRGHDATVWSVAYSPNGKQLASGSEDGIIRLWDLSDPTAEPQVLTGHENIVTSVAYSPDGNQLASGSDDGTIRLWDLSDPVPKQLVLRGHEDWVGSVAFSPDGRQLASGGGDQTIRLWDLSDPTAEPRALTGYESFVFSVAFSPDGEQLASGNYDGTIGLWNLSDPTAEPQVLRSHEAEIFSVAFSPDGGKLASGSWDRTIRLWDLGDPMAEPQTLIGHLDVVFSVAFSPDGEQLASGSGDGTIRLWDLSDPAVEPWVLTNHEAPVNSVAFSPDGRQLASGSSDGTIRLWDLSDPAAEPLVLRGHDNFVTSVAYSPDGEQLASGSLDGTIRLWDLSDPAVEPLALHGHEDWVNSVSFSPDGEQLASGSPDQTIRLWDLGDPTAEPLVLAGHDNVVNSVAFSPGGNQLASGSFDGTIRLWNLSDPTSEPLVLNGHKAWVGSVAFSPDGGQLASGSWDGIIRLWDLSDPTAEPRGLAGHEDIVNSVAFSPDGNQLASGSSDRTIRLWDLSDPTAEPLVLRGHEFNVESVAYSPNGERLASGSGDGTIRVWRNTLEGLAVFACEQAGRNFSWEEWQEFLPGRDYEKTCPQYPVHCSVPVEAWPPEYNDERSLCSAQS